MAKKFGKFLLLTTAAASAAAAVYYYMQKKDAETPIEEDEDFDDFGDDLDEDVSFSPNYVSLTPGCADCTLGEDACESCDACDTDVEEDDFTPLSEQISEVVEDAVETVEETVEEFFDEEENN